MNATITAEMLNLKQKNLAYISIDNNNFLHKIKRVIVLNAQPIEYTTYATAKAFNFRQNYKSVVNLTG